jgi:hypothetical protein
MPSGVGQMLPSRVVRQMSFLKMEILGYKSGESPLCHRLPRPPYRGAWKCMEHKYHCSDAELESGRSRASLYTVHVLKGRLMRDNGGRTRTAQGAGEGVDSQSQQSSR